MAQNTLLSIGVAYTLVQNQTYALPSRSVNIFGQGSGFEISNDASTWQAVTLGTNKEFITAAPFIRSTAVGSTVTVKPA